ncbi:MAG: hypothetical protein JNL75_02480 [Chitinophagales bacterium]|nr:hypothetical protein [Chitinophagales bacterium]
MKSKISIHSDAVRDCAEQGSLTAFQSVVFEETVVTPRYAPENLMWREQHLYGSSRLGMLRPDLDIVDITALPPADWLAMKQYELTNHLGNVLSTVKDEKLQLDLNCDGLVDAYEPIVLNATDYYPFGMPMPNRTYSLSSSNYRFGFNGKEKDNEIYGDGNAVDFGARVHDPRLGRWLSVDKKFQNSPYFTPYNFAANNPIVYIDPDGNTEFYFNGEHIGSDKIENGLIGIVTDLAIKIEIGEKKVYPSSIENGKAFNGGFALHLDVLKQGLEDFKRAEKSWKKGKIREQTSVMIKNSSGGYDVTFTGEGPDAKKSDSRASASIPPGDVSSHSHPLDVEVSKDGKSSYYDALIPSPPRADGKGGDKLAFKEYSINLIVGKNGVPKIHSEYEQQTDINGAPKKNSDGEQLYTKKINYTIIDGRESAINVFDSQSQLVGTVNVDHAKSIVKNENKRKK